MERGRGAHTRPSSSEQEKRRNFFPGNRKSAGFFSPGTGILVQNPPATPLQNTRNMKFPIFLISFSFLFNNEISLSVSALFLPPFLLTFLVTFLLGVLQGGCGGGFAPGFLPAHAIV